MGSARALVAMSGLWPACTCLVSNAQAAERGSSERSSSKVGSISSVMKDVSWRMRWGCRQRHESGTGMVQRQLHNGGLRIRFPCLLRGPSWRARACRVANRLANTSRLLNLVNHPGHPTAVGGLPGSEPGLDPGTHDRNEAYLKTCCGCQWVLAPLMAGCVMSPEGRPERALRVGSYSTR